MPQVADFAPLSLPNRPLALARDSFAPPRGWVFTVLLMQVFLAGITAWQGPALWRDLQIARNPVTLHDGQVLDGECSTRRGITDRSARLVYDYGGQSYDTHSEMAFVDFGSRDYLVDIVISGDRPELATMSIGIDKIWNRSIFFGVFVLLFGGGALAMFGQVLRARRNRGAWAGAARLSLVPVTLTQVQKARGSQTVSYRAESGPVTVTRFAGAAGPLVMADGSGTMRGVAVRREGVAVPALLDEGLARLDLSPDERAAALSQIAATTGRMPAPAHPPRRWLRRIVVTLLVLVLLAGGVFGYWLWYVTSGDAFNTPGKEINSLMPAALNGWGCEQLHARFPKSHPPTGCATECA